MPINLELMALQIFVLEFYGPVNNRSCQAGQLIVALFLDRHKPKWLTSFTKWYEDNMWTASSEFGNYRLCEQRRFRRACAFAQSRQNLRCLLIQAASQEEPSDRKPDPWPLWMAGHAQLKFVMRECSKTQIRLTGPIYLSKKLFTRSWL